MPLPKVWPIEAAGGEVAMTYGYLTDIMPGYNEAEQRFALRRVPIETVEFTILEHGRAAQLAYSLIYTRDELAVPLWQWEQRTDSSMASGSTSIPVTTADIPYLRPGTTTGFVLVWASPFDFQVFTISAVNPASIAVVESASKTWPAGTAVYPLRLARVVADTDLRWLDSPPTAEGRMTFTCEGT